MAIAASSQLERIRQLDDAGPKLNAVLTFATDAPQQAAANADQQPLAGRTVLVKDNIETREWPTTAGSLALQNNHTGRDAPLIANLRAAGGVVLGKTNLSEWANFRDEHSTSGWSTLGGLTRNPHAIDRNTCGSSSGSGAAVAAGFAWGAIGTETNGSIVCPASINGVVGFKPSVGLVSRTHVVPISARQDTAGPMSRTVHDAALLLSAIAGPDPDDPATAAVPNRKAAYHQDLSDLNLTGLRLGVLREQVGDREGLRDVFEQALADLQQAGAVLVDVPFEPDYAHAADHFYVLAYEFREQMNRYLATLPDPAMPRALDDLIAHNRAHSSRTLRFFGQSIFLAAANANDPKAYAEARENAQHIAGGATIDVLLEDHQVAFLLAPTLGPAWTSDLVNGDHFIHGIGFGSPPARGGYPHLTVPMGRVAGLPVGLSIVGGQWRDHAVLQAGAAYERVRTAVLPPPSFKPWSAQTPAESR